MVIIIFCAVGLNRFIFIYKLVETIQFELLYLYANMFMYVPMFVFVYVYVRVCVCVCVCVQSVQYLSMVTPDLWSQLVLRPVIFGQFSSIYYMKALVSQLKLDLYKAHSIGVPNVTIIQVLYCICRFFNVLSLYFD